MSRTTKLLKRKPLKTLGHMVLWISAPVLLCACNQPSTDTTDNPSLQTNHRQLIEVPAAQRKVQPHSDTPAINEMGAQCTAKIGVIKPFSCLDGEIIPIYQNGKLVTGAEGNAPDTCDSPSWLGGAYKSFCQPNARVGRLPNVNANGQPDDDVQNIFICRRYSFEASPTNPFFEDIAIIQHRKSTGDTCFFQHEPDNLTGNGNSNQPPHKINTVRVPPPAEPASATPKTCPTPTDPNAACPTAEEFWLTPADTAAIGCHGCHASAPFVRSPYISQVTKDGVPVVYPISDDPYNHYQFVGEAFNKVWAPPRYVKPDNNPCVNCHVAGYGMWYARLLSFSVGVTAPKDAMPEHCQGSTFYPPFSSRAKSYPHSHWMAPGVASGVSEAEWTELFHDAVQEILACMPTAHSDAECMPKIERKTQGCNITYFGGSQSQ